MKTDVIRIIDECIKRVEVDDFRMIFFQLLLYKYLSEKDQFICDVEVTYSEILNKAQQDALKFKDIEDALRCIELSTEETGYFRIFEGIFDYGVMKKYPYDVIKRIIIGISKIDIINIDTDCILENLAIRARMNNRMDTTAITVGKLMLELATLDINQGTVLDQTCGTASMLSKINRYMEATKIIGQESIEYTSRLAKINMILNDADCDKFDIITENCLYSRTLIDEKFDVQISDFPWKTKRMFDAKWVSEDIRYMKYRECPYLDTYFILNALHHMSEEDGRLAILIPKYFLDEKSSVIKSIREDCIKNNIIDAIIKLPNNTMTFTAIESYIVIFKKNKEYNDIFIMDATTYFVENKRKRVFEITDDNIRMVKDLYKQRNDVANICCAISYNEIEENKFSLESKKYIEKRKLLKLIKNETLIELSEVADIIRPKIISKEIKIKCMTPKTLKYPIHYDELEEGYETNTLLKKGDIIILGGFMKNMYLVDEEPKVKICARDKDIVIRPQSIQSEYLYTFLKSNVGKLIFEINTPSFIGLQRVTISAMNNICIPLPKKNKEEYRSIFEIENYLHIDIATYNRLLLNKKMHIAEETIEDVLNQEIIANVKVYKEDMMRKFLDEDIKELNACFRVKAYKATLILAGSILEAILIDWLSEIKGNNYFEEEYHVIGKNGFPKRADLIDYINEIKDIEKPNWMDEANKAHEIRKKRNLVHAKLCLKQSEKINEDTCRNVIDYLKDVIKTRGIDTK